MESDGDGQQHRLCETQMRVLIVYLIVLCVSSERNERVSRRANERFDHRFWHDLPLCSESCVYGMHGMAVLILWLKTFVL